MALTVAQAQSLIILKVGDVDPETGDSTTFTNGIVAANIGLLWESYSDLGLIDTRLQELSVQRDAIEIVLGLLARYYDVTDASGDSAKRNQVVKNYRDKYDAVVKELARFDPLLEELAQSGSVGARLPVVGQILATAPISPPCGGPDANDPHYSGTPYDLEIWPDAQLGSA